MKHLKELSKVSVPKAGSCGCSKLEDKSAKEGKEKTDKKSEEPT